MTSSSVDFAQIPISYAARLVAMLEGRGFAVATLLAGTGISQAMLADPMARVSFRTIGQLLANCVQATGDESVGMELGLGFKASSHGMLGLALLTCNSLRDAIMLGAQYWEVRGSPWRIQLIVDGETAIMRFVEVVAMDMRAVMMEAVLGAVIRLGEFMLGESFAQPAIEFWSDSPELPHHERFRDQLPPIRYNSSTMQALFPASWLDRPLALHEPIAHREAVTALQSEFRLIDPSNDLWDRTRALLASKDHGFPGLEQVATLLSVSSRTLRRHLKTRGTTFYALRDEARRFHAERMLDDSKLAIVEIALALGFSDAAGFVRAFQRWTHETPSNFRKRPRG
jgi:AraC-like DNA-binding protein